MLQNCASRRNQWKLRNVSPSLLKNASSIEWCRDAEEVSKVNSDLVNFVVHRLIQYLLHHHQSQGNYRDPIPKSQVKLGNRFPTDRRKGGEGRAQISRNVTYTFLSLTEGLNWPFRCLDSQYNLRKRSQIMRCFSSNCKRPPHYTSEMSKLPIVMHKSFWWEHVFKSFHLIAGSVSSLKVLMNLCEFSHTSRGHFKFQKDHSFKVLSKEEKW